MPSLRPSRIALPAVAALLMTAAPASAGKAFKPVNTTIVPSTSIAGVSIGQSLAKAKRAWPGVTCSILSGGKVAQCVWDGGKNGRAEFNARNGKVANATISTGYAGPRQPALTGPLVKLKTKGGLGLGSKPDAVAAGLPGGQLVAGSDGLPFRYTVTTGRTWTEFRYDGGVTQSLAIVRQ